MTLKTREGQDFLTINGIQTMSAQSYNLLHEVPDMLQMGRHRPRSVRSRNHGEIIAAFDAARRGEAVQADSPRLERQRPGRRLLVRRCRHRNSTTRRAGPTARSMIMNGNFTIPKFKLPDSSPASATSCRNGRMRWPWSPA
jgi:collagenase-like PrtC family protease